MPADDSPEAGRPRGRGWQRALTVALAVGAVSSLLSGVVRLPYYAEGPGDVLPISRLVRVTDGRAYEPTGSVSLVTVYQAQLTPLDLVRGWLDPDVDVLTRRQVFPPNTSAREARQQNLRVMASSKELALGVAFERLGVDAIQGDGAELLAIEPRSAATRAGLAIGDVITSVDGVAVQTHMDAIRVVGARRPGESVSLGVRSKAGVARTVQATLGSRPGATSKPFLGVGLGTKNLHFKFPFDVKLASEQIGGPSAGLGYTLEVLDVLTPGELTGGKKVAATGTIELDGTVGQIGGIRQKTAAVKRAGIDLFLVPRGELAAARRRAGKGLKVEAVDTLDDALRVLARYGGNGLDLQPLEERGAA
jgi:PDZ domain-containing protein